MAKKTQSELIGSHPANPFFSKWLQCEDKAVTATKIHRALTQLIPATSDELVEWLGRKLFDHHHSEFRVEQLKAKYKELGFKKYAEQHRQLPKADKTRKGNATEVILTDYIENCRGKQLIKVFKLQYNPNVDQAMKGDDTLMIELISNGKTEKPKLYLGEAKFRKTPAKAVVDEIAKALPKSKKPLSYTFLIEKLAQSEDTKSVAKLLDGFLIDDIKAKGDLVYTGLLLSNTDTVNVVEANLSCKNPDLIFISVGIDSPEELINKAFEKAEFYVQNPDKL